jgi:nicotinamide-nucleotide amidase
VITRAAILSTGDELTTGRIADTNAQWIADKLFECGVEVPCVLVVGDFPARLAWAWCEALAQADLVISTGGIGPTADDLTTETVARVLGVPLAMDEASAERMRRFFAARGVDPMPENNLKQAMIPAGAVVVPNALGTAPGYRATFGEKHLVVLPGVPREMKPMVEETVLPWLRAQRGGEVYLARTFQTFGISESGLDQLVAGVVDPAEGRLSFRASFPEVSLRLVVHGTPEHAAERLAAVGDRLHERLGEYCYAEGARSMEEAVGQALRERGLRLALAESCTGGLVAHRVTNVPGSSAYFLGAIGAYADGAKQSLLGVPATTLERHGAVNEETACAMANGARRAFGADVAVATTGIAGPDGGTADKPVGLVCFALASADGVRGATHQLWGTRDWVKLLASQLALDMIRRHALGLGPHDPTLFRRR